MSIQVDVLRFFVLGLVLAFDGFFFLLGLFFWIYILNINQNVYK